MKDVASGRREGEMSFEIVEKFVTPELACVVEMERAEAKFGASEDVTSYALRATILFRREEGTWKVAHRHAHPISSVQQAASYEVDE
jgi:ketosteroid isomerase-like protein